jgi:hypothetical protein
VFCIEEGPKYRPLHDLRSVLEAGRSREQVENQGRACTQVVFVNLYPTKTIDGLATKGGNLQ